MKVETTAAAAESQEARLLAVPFGGVPTPLFERLDAALDGRLARAVATGEATSRPGAVALVQTESRLAAERVALVGVGTGELDLDGLRMAGASAARALATLGGTLAWAFDAHLGFATEAQVRGAVEGALLGGHDPARWKSEARSPVIEALVIVGAPREAAADAARAEVVARWTNHARELVDAPPNEMTPDGLAGAASDLLVGVGVDVEVLAVEEIERLGLRALAAVGQGSANPPRLVVLRLRSGPETQRLGLVGKAITFDSGGFFLKPQSDIVRQKADMGGGAAVIAAVGALAELGVRLDVVAAIPAAENMVGGGAYRPGDIITTAAGLTVEITNPDAEGRLVMADALWFVQREGVARLIDVATLTGAMRAGMGDLYSGVFSNDDALRSEIVDAGNASGDYAWPWPMHPRYRGLLDSELADLKNTAGRSFGYPIVAATFLERFVSGVPWAHLDIYSTAYLDEERDYFARGATGAGVRLLVEVATRLAG